ncbi:MAG: hypothetical protein HFI95_18580 [Lachnospiraceae bacterium]|jgi:hypothetical protein|nr:hypothetical protein [Lachnospiraceae bacterium]
MMAGKKMLAVAKRDYEFSSIEKWKEGEKYNMVYDELGGVIELESDGGYIGHWSTAAFKEIRDNFDIKL